VQIIQGDIKLTVNDFENIEITKSNKNGEKNIHVAIPSKDLTKSNNADSFFGLNYFDAYGLSSFINLHLTIESQDKKSPASYTITYSSGDP
jgi:hypothetical protein